jgi:ribosome biogenesis protein BRX1
VKSVKNNKKAPVLAPAVSSNNSSALQGLYRNKQRVLIIASRGITARHRHLLEDLKKLIPHHKKDNKLDSKGDISIVNELCELKSCNNVIYLEARKHMDLYMYMGCTPHGPSVKFHVVNVHTTDELKLTGNCMLGSRPLLNFDSKFDTSAHWQVMKEILNNTFGVPRGHPKSKPFIDRVMSFFIVKNSIWVRNFQIVDKNERGIDDINLVEIGPRMVLIPIRIFNGSMGGPTLYQNMAYVSPNEERSEMKKRKGDSYAERVDRKKVRSDFIVSNKPPTDLLKGNTLYKK